MRPVDLWSFGGRLSRSLGSINLRSFLGRLLRGIPECPETMKFETLVMFVMFVMFTFELFAYDWIPSPLLCLLLRMTSAFLMDSRGIPLWGTVH